MLVTPVRAISVVDGEHYASLADLLVRTGRGDVRAFGCLYDATSVRVHALVCRAVGPESAEAVTERVYVRLWQRASAFAPEDGHALAWIVSLVHHEATGHAAQAPLACRVCADKPGPALTRSQQDVLTLVYLGGYSPRQVAELMQVPPTAVSKHVRTGLRRLKPGVGGAPVTPQWLKVR